MTPLEDKTLEDKALEMATVNPRTAVVYALLAMGISLSRIADSLDQLAQRDS